MTEPEKIDNLFCQSVYCYWCIFHKKEKNTENCLYKDDVIRLLCKDFAQSLEKEKQNKERNTEDEIHSN